MKLFFILSKDVRKNRAVSVDTMKICSEFAKNGFEVRLITPRRFRLEYRKSKEEIWSLYNLPKTFSIVELPTILWDNMSAFLSRLQQFPIFLLYYLYCLIRGHINKDTILFSSSYVSYVPALLLQKLGLLKCKFVFLKYDFTKDKKIHSFVARSVDGMIVINEYLKKQVINAYGLDENRVFRAGFPSQYEEMRFLLNFNTEEVKKQLGFSPLERIAMYAGKISPKLREIHYILDAAKYLPEVKFVLLGLREISRRYFDNYVSQNKLHNVVFIGFQPLLNFYKYIKASDVLISYYDSSDPLSVYQRVPAKASIYLAAEKPVIFADLPSLREWWDDSLVYFVSPDQPKLLADKIRYVLDHPAEAKTKAMKCLEFAKENTYSSTYREVSNFIKSLSKNM